MFGLESSSSPTSNKVGRRMKEISSDPNDVRNDISKQLQGEIPNTKNIQAQKGKTSSAKAASSPTKWP